MSDSDDDFGPALPVGVELAVASASHAKIDSDATQAVGAPPQHNVKRPRDEDSFGEEHNIVAEVPPVNLVEEAPPAPHVPLCSLVLSSSFDRSYIHGSPITSVAHIAWASGEMVLTLSAGDRTLYWWLKLPKTGLFLAKCTPLSSNSRSGVDQEVDAPVQHSEVPSCLLLQTGSIHDPSLGRSAAVVVDRDGGHFRYVMPELLELGPRIFLPQDVRSCLRSSSAAPCVHLWQPSTTASNVMLLIIAHEHEPKVTIVKCDSATASGGELSYWTVGSGTMHPIVHMGTHEASGLLIVMDAKGIVDYVTLDVDAGLSSPMMGSAATGGIWRLVRGTDEFSSSSKSSGKKHAPKVAQPHWAAHITFPARAKTHFFAAFRETQAPVALTVGSRTFTTTCIHNTSGDLVHRVYSVASGKVIGVSTTSSVGNRPLTCCCDAANAVGRSDEVPTGPTSAWCTVGGQCGKAEVVAWPFHGDSSDAGEANGQSIRWALSGPAQCDSPLQPVMCIDGHRPPVTQQLRNMITRSPFGIGLGSEAINALLGGSNAVSHTNKSASERERLLVCVNGCRLVIFSSESDEVADDDSRRRREFRCDDIAASLGLQVLQKDALDDAPSQRGPQDAAASALAREALFATIVVACYEQTPLRFRLLPFVAPLAVTNFKLLSESGFYNGLKFHRIIKEFMLQGGCPKGDGTGSKCLLPLADVSRDGAFVDEFITANTMSDPLGEIQDLQPLATMTRRYLLCMANSGPNTNGSQFFITTAPTPWLAGRHTVFGVLTASTSSVGLDAMTALLHLLEKVEVDRSAAPLRPVVMTEVTISRGHEVE